MAVVTARASCTGPTTSANLVVLSPGIWGGKSYDDHAERTIDSTGATMNCKMDYANTYGNGRKCTHSRHRSEKGHAWSTRTQANTYCITRKAVYAFLSDGKTLVSAGLDQLRV